MCGFVILFCWMAIAIIFILFSRLCESDILLGIGVTMLLMMSMVNDVTY